jgi:hypothetical protein
MKAAHRYLMAMSIAVLVTGCSSYQTVVTGPGSPDRNPGDPAVEELEIGDRVRITLADGRCVSGVVTMTSPDVLSLAGGEIDRDPAIDIDTADITHIERRQGDSRRVAMIVTAIGAAALIVGGIAAFGGMNSAFSF